jgi:hypothetical protein
VRDNYRETGQDMAVNDWDSISEAKGGYVSRGVLGGTRAEMLCHVLRDARVSFDSDGML